MLAEATLDQPCDLERVLARPGEERKNSVVRGVKLIRMRAGR